MPQPVVGATTLAPGRESSLTIAYTVREVAGDQSFKYIVISNDPASPEVELFLTVPAVTD